MKRRFYQGFFSNNSNTTNYVQTSQTQLVRQVPSPASVRSMLMQKHNQKNSSQSSISLSSASSGTNKNMDSDDDNINKTSSVPERYRLEQIYRRYKQNHRQQLQEQKETKPIWAELSGSDFDNAVRGLFSGSERSLRHARKVSPHFFNNRRAFIGNCIEDYTNKYWCVKFTYVGLGHENREMQRYTSWYAVKCKVVYLDYLPFVGNKIKAEIQKRMNGPATTELPVLFVNGKCVGGLSTLRALEESGRLKDVLQFGFLWHSRPDAGPDVSPQGLPVPPSFYGDEEMFRGQWRGAPVSAPVVELPKYLPRDSITYGRATGDKR